MNVPPAAERRIRNVEQSNVPAVRVKLLALMVILLVRVFVELPFIFNVLNPLAAEAALLMDWAILLE